MLTSEDFIRAGTVVNAFVMDSLDILDPEVLTRYRRSKTDATRRFRFRAGCGDDLSAG